MEATYNNQAMLHLLFMVQPQLSKLLITSSLKQEPIQTTLLNIQMLYQMLILNIIVELI